MRIMLAALVAALALAGVAPGATVDVAIEAPDAPALPAAPDAPDAPALPAVPDEAPPLPAPPEAPLPAPQLPGPEGDEGDLLAPLAIGETADEPRAPPLVPDAWADVLADVPPAAPVAVAAAGGLAVLEALGIFRWLGAGLIAGYTRLTKSELLDNEHRDAVYKLIQAEPGIALSEVAERAGLGWGTTVYHLDRLERSGFVASERSGLRRCFFPVGTLPKESRKGIGALKADTARSIAEYLVERPGATQGELAAALGMSASAASKQVTKLEEAGLVRREREWKSVRLHPAAGLASLLRPIAA